MAFPFMEPTFKGVHDNPVIRINEAQFYRKEKERGGKMKDEK